MSPRSHVDTPAWQSFELRMRARAAEHRAAKRKRRVRYAAAGLCAAVLAAGGAIGVQEIDREVSASAVSWPEAPAPPGMSIPSAPEPVPLPLNWDMADESTPLTVDPTEEFIAPQTIVPTPPLARPTIAERAAQPAPQPEMRPETQPATQARRAPRVIDWPPRPREEPAPALEPVRLADPPPATLSALPTPVTAAPRVDPQAPVRNTIERYRSAYEHLDASAARAVWPGVDAGALARAFDSLASQQLSFENCAITVSGTGADATCTGRSIVRPKLGGGSESARRTWQFKLRQAGSEWVIERVQTGGSDGRF